MLLRNAADDDQIIIGVTEVTVTIQDDDPATPTNLEIVENRTDPGLGHVAVLQWDYSDAQGYLLESRDGASGPWNCIVAGTYSSREPTGTSTVSTTRGGAMAASEDWHFQVRSFNSEEFSYPGEATCDSSAEYGYIFSTVDDQGYNLSPADTLGPVAIPAIDPTVRPTWQPTGLTIAAGAKHRDVQISWDDPTGRQQRHRLRPLPEMAGRIKYAPPLPLLVHQGQRVHHQLPGHARRRLRRPPATRTSTSTRCTRSTPPSHRTCQPPAAATTTGPAICSRRPQ